jgi:hypothetical protein
MSTVERAPRKCSQCRQERCNKSKATCPVNVARTGYTLRQLLPVAGTCELCRREGCFTECPIKMLIDHHTSVANSMINPITMVGRVYYQININPNLFDHIENITLRQQYLTRLKETIRDIYMLPVVNNITRLINSPMVLKQSVIPQKKVVFDVLQGYKMCSEECGICYDKTCNVTFNCAHQSCVDCFKGHVTSIAAKNFPILKCPFCRSTIDSVQSSDKNTHDTLVNLN